MLEQRRTWVVPTLQGHTRRVEDEGETVHRLIRGVNTTGLAIVIAEASIPFIPDPSKRR
jgi:hypothetical protein